MEFWRKSKKSLFEVRSMSVWMGVKVCETPGSRPCLVCQKSFSRLQSDMQELRKVCPLAFRVSSKNNPAPAGTSRVSNKSWGLGSICSELLVPQGSIRRVTAAEAHFLLKILCSLAKSNKAVGGAGVNILWAPRTQEKQGQATTKLWLCMPICYLHASYKSWRIVDRLKYKKKVISKN